MASSRDDRQRRNPRGSKPSRDKAHRAKGAKRGEPRSAGREQQRSGRVPENGRGRRTDRSGSGDRKAPSEQTARPRRDLKGAAADLPHWVTEELARVTPANRVAAALEALGEASEAFVAGKHHAALRKAQRAKDLAPRDATVREILGLAAYRVGDWGTALSELRTYRRITGETTHLPVEMDVLRAQGRNEDVRKAWNALQERGGKPPVLKEGAVVYASFLIDIGEIAEARRLTRPKRLTHEPFPEDLKLWYVAARAAALDGDGERARTLRNQILENDPGFPGIDELEELIIEAG